jgi:hypothetical protein
MEWRDEYNDVLREKYPLLDYTIAQIAGELGVARSTVRRRAKGLGLERPGKQGNPGLESVEADGQVVSEAGGLEEKVEVETGASGAKSADAMHGLLSDPGFKRELAEHDGKMKRKAIRNKKIMARLLDASILSVGSLLVYLGLTAIFNHNPGQIKPHYEVIHGNKVPCVYYEDEKFYVLPGEDGLNRFHRQEDCMFWPDGRVTYNNQ